jgi:RNA exonuclease 4
MTFSPQLDVYVHPTTPVVDYRTPYHGLDERHLAAPEARNFIDVQANVAELLTDRVLVGYCLWESLALLNLTHTALKTRDVAT